MEEQLEGILTCAICLDRFVQPKMLPCQHTFCLTPCLQNLVVGNRITCPHCRRVHVMPPGGLVKFPNNLAIGSILDIKQEPKPPPVQPCPECMKGCKKPQLCQHCEKGICEECFKVHTQQIIRSLMDSVDEVRSVLPVISDVKANFDERQVKLKSNGESVKTDVSDAIDRCIAQLNNRKQTLLGQVDSYVNSELRQLKSEQEKVEKELLNINKHCENSESKCCTYLDNGGLQDQTLQIEVTSLTHQSREYLRNIKLIKSNIEDKMTSSIKFQNKKERSTISEIANFGEVIHTPNNYSNWVPAQSAHVGPHPLRPPKSGAPPVKPKTRGPTAPLINRSASVPPPPAIPPPSDQTEQHPPQLNRSGLPPPPSNPSAPPFPSSNSVMPPPPPSNHSLPPPPSSNPFAPPSNSVVPPPPPPSNRFVPPPPPSHRSGPPSPSSNRLGPPPPPPTSSNRSEPPPPSSNYFSPPPHPSNRFVPPPPPPSNQSEQHPPQLNRSLKPTSQSGRFVLPPHPSSLSSQHQLNRSGNPRSSQTGPPHFLNQTGPPPPPSNRTGAPLLSNRTGPPPPTNQTGHPHFLNQTGPPPLNRTGPPPPSNRSGPPTPPSNRSGPPTPPSNRSGPPPPPLNRTGPPPPPSNRTGPPPPPSNRTGPPPPPSNRSGPHSSSRTGPSPSQLSRFGPLPAPPPSTRKHPPSSDQFKPSPHQSHQSTA